MGTEKYLSKEEQGIIARVSLAEWFLAKIAQTRNTS